MCGLAGYLGGVLPAERVDHVLQGMADAIQSRGPDDSDCWADVENRIGFGHRRLAIVDLSAAGRQPMASASGRYVIAYNGEIYNHMELRRALTSNWRGHADTETLLAGFEAWGIRGCLERAVGMFAFAVWDSVERTLTLARDRMGEKPMYYGWQGTGADAVFLFGSQLKALAIHPQFERRVDRDAVTLLLRHNCIPAPYSVYQHISKLLPGSMLTVSLDRREPRISAYWSALAVAQEGIANPFSGTAEEATDELERLVSAAIGRQMMSDVPLGAFLSGGVDSSAIVALMQKQSTSPVKTFTIGFHEDAYNEARHARMVATHLGTDHTELYLSAADAMAVIPDLPTYYDEPFADSSQIPTFLVSRLARTRVTVSLSGDAGDELFAGYNRYAATARYWRQLSRVPAPVRRALAGMMTSVSPGQWTRAADVITHLIPGAPIPANPGDKVHKIAGALGSESSAKLYQRLVSHWTEASSVVQGGVEPPTLLNNGAAILPELNDVERMMALDAVTYLPDDILVKVDRASMAVSLESRVPYLDPSVVQFAWRLPLGFKIRDGQTKWILRQVLYRHVPRTLIERPKMGFSVPLDDWLRGPLRDWAEALLDEHRLTREGFFRPEKIRRKWAEHLSGRRSRQAELWDVLMFQAWLEHQSKATG